MKRTRESKRVSWAAEANLCQVKIFSSEDYPSKKVGQKTLAHHQTKTSLILNSNANNESYDDIPPGFEGKHFLNQSKVEFSLAPQIKWECPPQFIFDPSVVFLAAGEQSWEKVNQEQRELTVVESFYPKISTIPPSPSVSLYVEEEHYDDNATPLIPHEEQEECFDDPETAATTVSSSSLSKSVGIPASELQNIVPSVPFSTPPTPTDAATTISTTSLLSSSGLRPEILPLPLPNLTHDEGESTVSVPIFPFSRPMSGPATKRMSFLPAPMAPYMQRVNQNILRSNATPHALNLQPPQQNTVLSYGVKYGASSLPSIVSNKSNLVPMPSAIVNMNAPLNQFHPTARIVPYQLNTSSAFAVRDANYYKDLIRQYGIEKQDMVHGSQIRMNHTSFQELSQVHIKQREVKQKIQKPCKYFKSSSGCRNGSNCTYLHNMSAQGEGHNAKIIRL